MYLKCVLNLIKIFFFVKLKVCNDIQPQRAQRVDYNRLKHERTQEAVNQQYNNNIISPELLEYAYPFHYQSEDNHGKTE
jgi:predicted amidohydrolase